MITKPMDVLEQFPVRKTKKQKAAFRGDLQRYIEGQGYQVRIEEGSLGARNILVGDPERAKYLVTAHYDTPASIGIPNFITPCNPVFFFLFQFLIIGGILVLTGGLGMLIGALAKNRVLGMAVFYVVYMVTFILMMIGPANRNNANDNTSGVVTVLEILSTLPENLRGQVCFVLFDLEELGLVGSASYRKTHKTATERQHVLNLDCVGDGDHLLLFPVKKAKLDEPFMEALRKLCGKHGNKRIHLREYGFTKCPSDQKNFPNAVGIMAFHYKKGIGYYCNRIHTKRDTVLEYTNVNILRAAIISLIAQF